MRHRVLVFAWLLIFTGGCTTSDRPTEIRYMPPADLPPVTSEVRVLQSDRLVWDQLLERLQRSPLTVERADRPSGLIVTTYKGNPEPYIDCGWIITYGPHDLVRTPAAAHEATFGWLDNGEWLSVKRSLELDGRMVVQVRRAGADTLLSIDSTYVVTKALSVDDASSRPGGRTYDIASFTTTEEGTFAKGTVCRPTGQLELLATGAVPAGATRTAGAPSEASLDCAGADAAFCEVRELIAPFENANRQRELGLALRTVGGATLFEGDPLVLDISFPNFDSFLHIAYIQRSGIVGNILPGRRQVWPANAAQYVEQTGYYIAPPYGVEMILALATRQPLFPTPRPEFESVGDFFQALRQRLTELTANDPARFGATHVLVITKPRETLGSARAPSF